MNCVHLFILFITNYHSAVINREKDTFAKRWKKALILPIIKPGQEGSDDVSKFRPIILLDIGRKALEKILINRINHHVYSEGYMNENQFGFRPQKCTIDAAMAKKTLWNKVWQAER